MHRTSQYLRCWSPETGRSSHKESPTGVNIFSNGTRVSTVCKPASGHLRQTSWPLRRRPTHWERRILSVESHQAKCSMGHVLRYDTLRERRRYHRPSHGAGSRRLFNSYHSYCQVILWLPRRSGDKDKMRLLQGTFLQSGTPQCMEYTHSHSVKPNPGL